MRKNYLCINPFHFGYEHIQSTETKENHVCRRNLRFDLHITCTLLRLFDNFFAEICFRLQITGSTLRTICKVCRKIQNDEDLTDSFLNKRAIRNANKSSSTSTSQSQLQDVSVLLQNAKSLFVLKF